MTRNILCCCLSSATDRQNSSVRTYSDDNICTATYCPLVLPEYNLLREYRSSHSPPFESSTCHYGSIVSYKYHTKYTYPTRKVEFKIENSIKWKNHDEKGTNHIEMLMT